MIDTKQLLFIITLLIGSSINAQQLKGIIRNNEGEALSDVTIYIKESMTGTASNEKGEYQIVIPQGLSHISFRSLGYQTVEIEAESTSAINNRDITMTPRPIIIREVRVSPGKEDPAYPIMRRAIATAPIHLKEVLAFNSEVYLKGTINFKKIPKIVAKHIEVNGRKIKPGEIFSMESINEISFTSPDKYEHKVVSQRSTFPPGTGQENEYIGYISNSFYQPSIGITISPLSPSAFTHYRFVYEDFFIDQGMEINRIRVIPKRKSQQLFAGYINIVDKSWSLQSVELTNEAFWGKLKIKQTFAPVKDNAWLPVNHNFAIDADAIGVKIVGSYIGSVKYKWVTINEKAMPASQPSMQQISTTGTTSREKKSSENMQKIKEIMEKPNLKQSDMARVVRLMEKQERLDDTTANNRLITNNYHVTHQKDSANQAKTDWDMIRPVPLTADEINSFKAKDSLVLTLKKVNKDTVAVKYQKSWLSTLLWGAKTPYNSKKNLKINYNGLIDPAGLTFHPVTGFSYMQNIGGSYRVDSLNTLNFKTSAGYAFSARMPSWNINMGFNNRKAGGFGFSAGHNFIDYKGLNSANPHINSILNLTIKENYIALLRQHFYAGSYNKTIADGLTVMGSIRYAHYIKEENNSNFSFLSANKDYKPNIPINKHIKEIHTTSSSQAITGVTISYTPMMKYRMIGGRKIPAGSDYPTFLIAYRQGIGNLWNSRSDFSHFNVDIRQSREWGVFYNLTWQAEAGFFTNAVNLNFSQWKHWGGSDIPIVAGNTDGSFFTAPAYMLSVNSRYAGASVTYQTPLLVLKYLPLLSNGLWSEDIYLRHVTTPQFNYSEAGYGISRIIGFMRAAAFASFENGKYRSTHIRIGMNF